MQLLAALGGHDREDGDYFKARRRLDVCSASAACGKGKGNEGVANNVNYAAFHRLCGAFVCHQTQNEICPGEEQGNKAGAFVDPSATSFQAAAASAEWKTDDFYEVITDAPSKGGLAHLDDHVRADVPRAEKSGGEPRGVEIFFKWTLENGQGDAQQLDYGPLPACVAEKIRGMCLL